MTDNQKLYKALSKIAYGFIFILVHIRIGPIDILPDFVGYIMITSAIFSLKNESRTILLLEPLGVFLSVWNAVAVLLSLSDISSLPFINYLSIIIQIINIYFYFQLFTDISHIAKKYQPEDTAFDKKFIIRRNIYIVTQTLILILNYFFVSDSFLRDIFDISDDITAYLIVPVSLINFIVLVLIVSAIFSFRKIFKENSSGQNQTENYNDIAE